MTAVAVPIAAASTAGAAQARSVSVSSSSSASFSTRHYNQSFTAHTSHISVNVTTHGHWGCYPGWGWYYGGLWYGVGGIVFLL
ncbi:hypothetical protein GCM10020229_09600 [Kitasatospora albolonga]|uniref:hypothetical protein n=1 Tax=Kitasatospora albolonga TaxID=68173 RepID=UPI0031EBB7B7